MGTASGVACAALKFDVERRLLKLMFSSIAEVGLKML